MRVHIVDPPAYTPPYDHALCAALSRAGVDVELITSPFSYGDIPNSNGYAVAEHFYCRTATQQHPRLRQAIRLASHVPDMVRYTHKAKTADVVHFQWCPVQQVDSLLLPRNKPLVLTAHDVLPREPKRGQLAGQRRLYERADAVVVHSQHGAQRLTSELNIDTEKVHITPHGAFHEFTKYPKTTPLPPALDEPKGPVVLFFGLIRPYKGLDVLLEAWREVNATQFNNQAELWVAGMPRMDISELRAKAAPNVRWVPRYIAGAELAAIFHHADIVVLPYRQIDQSGVLFTSLAFGKPLALSAVGAFPEIAETGAAELFPPEDPSALAALLTRLLTDEEHRNRLSTKATKLAAPDGPFGWDSIAGRTIDLYNKLLISATTI